MILFAAHHVRWLEKQIEDERIQHAKELERALLENKRLQDECERLRLALGQPSRVAELPPEPPIPVDPDAMPTFSGLPFDRVIQREEWLRTPNGKRWMAKQLASVKPVSSGETPKEN